MKTIASCVLACLLSLASTVLAQTVVEVEISGTFDLEQEMGVTLPSGLGIGTTYTVLIQYRPALAGPDVAAAGDEFQSALDIATTQFAMNAAGQIWTLPGSDTSFGPNEELTAFHRVQSGANLGRYELRAAAAPDPSEFPGLFTSAFGTRAQMRFVLEEALLWTDLVLPAIEHLSDAGQIDLGVVDSAFFEIAAVGNSSTDRWVVADRDAEVTIRVEGGPVRSRETTWSRLKAGYED